MSKKREAGDLRVRRTRKLLREALMLVVEEKGYEAVSVREVAERAMVNRATFYAHYEDKYDLLLDIIGEMFEPVRNSPPPTEPDSASALAELRERLVGVLEHIAAHSGFYRGVLGDGGSARVRADLRTYLEGLLRQQFRVSGVEAEGARVPPEFVVGCASASALGMLSWWLENGTPYPAREIAARWSDLLAPGVHHALGLPVPDEPEDRAIG